MLEFAGTGLVPTDWPLETSIFHIASCCLRFLPPPPKAVLCPAGTIILSMLSWLQLGQDRASLSHAQAATLDVMRLPELGFGRGEARDSRHKSCSFST